MDDNQNNSNFKILSLSGGGIRGLFTLQILAQLEQYQVESTGDQDYKISQHFDLICGTSIGGIVALGLAYGLTARKLLEIIDKNRLIIFPHLNKYHRKFKQLLSGIYDPSPLKDILAELFSTSIIGELETRILIPVVNYSTGAVQVFKTPHHLDFRQDWRYPITDVALATSAAPTYFPVHEFNSNWYVDGGLAANSPSLMGVHEANYYLGIDYSSISLMSIGTMGTSQTANQEEKRTKGYFNGWSAGEEILKLTLSANEGLHNMIASHLIPDENYLSIDDFQTPEQSKVLELDNASDGAAKILKARGLQKAQNVINDPKYQKFVQVAAPDPIFYYGPQAATQTPPNQRGM